MSNNGFIKNNNTITVSVDGKVFAVNAGNKALYDAVTELVKAGRYSEVPDTVDRLSNLVKQVATNTAGFGNIAVRDRRVYFVSTDGTEQRLVGYEITKLLELIDNKFDAKPLTNFIIRVRQNPSEAVRARLYEFMEYGNMPLTEDGSFLAYKVVRSNYKDKYSNTFDNSVGKTCEMKREDVNDNDAETCSRGLHVCSKEYLSFFQGGNDHLMVVKVAPEDVVSIPVDYNNTKMRTCKYKVIAEVKDTTNNTYFSAPVHVPTPPASGPKRDAAGRFVSAVQAQRATGPKRDASGRFVAQA